MDTALERIVSALGSLVSQIREQPGLSTLIVIGLAVASYFVIRHLLFRWVPSVVARRRAGWAKFLRQRRLFSYVAFLASAAMIYLLLPPVLAESAELANLVGLISSWAIIFATALALSSGLNTASTYTRPMNGADCL